MEAKNLNSEWVKKFDESLANHIKYYREAVKIIGGIPKSIWSVHDESKYSKYEYPAYVRKFGGGIKDDAEFGAAWLHHLHLNPHHPEFYIIPGEEGEKDTVLEMPEVFVREMVADWMGSSKAYTGSFDMEDWLKKNFNKKKLHPKSRTYAVSVLKDIGQWFSELECTR